MQARGVSPPLLGSRDQRTPCHPPIRGQRSQVASGKAPALRPQACGVLVAPSSSASSGGGGGDHQRTISCDGLVGNVATSGAVSCGSRALPRIHPCMAPTHHTGHLYGKRMMSCAAPDTQHCISQWAAAHVHWPITPLSTPMPESRGAPSSLWHTEAAGTRLLPWNRPLAGRGPKLPRARLAMGRSVWPALPLSSSCAFTLHSQWSTPTAYGPVHREATHLSQRHMEHPAPAGTTPTRRIIGRGMSPRLNTSDGLCQCTWPVPTFWLAHPKSAL